MSGLRTLIHAWQDRRYLGDSRLPRDELEFLPAALEIQSRPPSPLGRTLMWTLLGLFVVALLWAWFGHVDIVAVAEGRIVPTGKVKQVQPLDKGVISAILVAEGDRVVKGQALVELDATETVAEQQRLRLELLTLDLNLVRLQRLAELLSGRAQPALIQSWPADSSPAQQALQQRLLEQQWQHYRGQRRALEHSLAGRQAERDTSLARRTRLAGTLPLIAERANALKRLAERKMAARLQYLELEQQRVENAEQLTEEGARLRQLQAAGEEIKVQLQVLTAQARSRNLEALVEAQRQRHSLVKELSKARKRNQRRILHAPVDGIVKELVPAAIGEVVTPAQALMLIVPENEALVVEAYLANKDIGFVRKQMLAAIKVHTFPFTKYGLIDAEVVQISADALVDDNRGLIYKVRLLMQRDWLNVEGSKVALMPGMAVTAEVKTGTRRIIEYFLAPLLRYRQESVRER